MIETEARTRVILLGASNVTRGISSLVGTARQALGGPLEVLAAYGHGRSLGQRSRFFNRGLPGMTECGLWRALEQRNDLPTYVLLTDIGTDIMYGATSEQIGGWIRTILERLHSAGARVVMTRLPIRGFRRVTPMQFGLVKDIFFSGRDMDLDEILARAERVGEDMDAIAGHFGVTLVDQRPEWYGFDPIHIRRWKLPQAWTAMLSHWVDQSRRLHPVGPAPMQFARIRLMKPQLWWRGNNERNRPQPAGSLPDGTTVSLF